METIEHQIKPRNKLTRLGNIPQDWEAPLFGEIFKMTSGSTPSRTKPEYFKGDLLWVTSGELNYDIIDDTCEKITSEGARSSSLTIYPKGTFLIAITGLEATGTRGRCAILGKPGTVNQSCMAFERRKDVDTKYQFYFYRHFAEHITFTFAQGSKQQSLPKNILEKVTFIKPPLPEQQKIAQILSTWDQAISKTKQLIRKKQLRKKGLIQQLLTGKKRFKEFVKSKGMQETKLGWIPEDWEVKELGELGHFLKGKGVPKSKIKDAGQPCLTYGELYTKYNNIIRAFYSFIDEETASGSQELMLGDILFAGSGETLEEIGKSAAFVHQFRAFAGGDIIILRSHGQSPEYLGYLLNHNIVNRQKHKLGQGHSVVHIYSSSLRGILIPIPSIEEQKKIASILLKVDDEVAKLRIQLTKLKMQKKGLMQKLLTGEVRVHPVK